jgi:trimethylamine--corrinoid protein Co-methyltransferase
MWGVPTLAGVGTEAPASGWESAAGCAASLLLCALCGAETGSGFGLREACTLLCREALVLDTDLYHQVRIDTAGLDVSQEAFALDVIKAVGPRGHFLGQKHTRDQMRKWQLSELTAQPNGGVGYKDPIELAWEKTEWILEHHHPEPLEEAQGRELRQILQSADREAG